MLGKLKLLAGDLAALVAGRNRAELFQGQQIGTGIHDTAGNDDGGDVDAAHGHEVRRQALIAAGDKDTGVERGGLGMDLDHVGDHLTACQTEIDAVRSLALAITDIRTKIARSKTAFLGDSFSYFFYQKIQMAASRVAVPIGTFHHHLYLSQIFLLPAGSNP